MSESHDSSRQHRDSGRGPRGFHHSNGGSQGERRSGAPRKNGRSGGFGRDRDDRGGYRSDRGNSERTDNRGSYRGNREEQGRGRDGYRGGRPDREGYGRVDRDNRGRTDRDSYGRKERYGSRDQHNERGEGRREFRGDRAHNSGNKFDRGGYSDERRGFNGPRKGRDERPARGDRYEGGRGYRNEQDARGGYRGNREDGNGYRGNREERSGYRGNQENGGGYRGNREDKGIYRGNRENSGGFRKDRESYNSYRGNRDDNGGFRKNRGEERGDFRGPRSDHNGNSERREYRGSHDDRGQYNSNRSHNSDRSYGSDRGGNWAEGKRAPRGKYESDKNERGSSRHTSYDDNRESRPYRGDKPKFQRNSRDGERRPFREERGNRDRHRDGKRDGQRDFGHRRGESAGYRGRRDDKADGRRNRDEHVDRRDFLDSPEAFDQDRQERVREGREPYVPAEITGSELAGELRGELKALTKEQMERVSRHLVACSLAQQEDDDARALEHAKWAARFGARVAAVREIYGALLYDAAEYKAALRELRAAMRISGRVDLLPMIADSERGLGRPEKALDVAQLPEARSLSDAETIELMIVVAGAYADMGDLNTAIATLEVPALRHKVDGKWQFRLWLAYADLLEQDGQTDEARKWITLAADADTEEETDAGQRLGRAPKPVEQPALETSEQIGVIDVYAEFMAEEAEAERERRAAEREAREETAADEEALAEETMSENRDASAYDAEAEAEFDDVVSRVEDTPDTFDTEEIERDGLTNTENFSELTQEADAEENAPVEDEEWVEPDEILDDEEPENIEEQE